jgi:hypothetical protein
VTTLFWTAPQPSAGPPDPIATLPDPVRVALGDVVERLHQDHRCCLPLSAVAAVVLACLDDIQATPASALPELAERLARFRLAENGHRPGCTARADG